MLGTVYRLHSKNCHLGFKKAPVDYVCGKFEVLTNYSYGDINQNSVKIRILPLLLLR